MKRILTVNRKKELEYFCLQYWEWKALLQTINLREGTSEWDDPTFDEVAYRQELEKNIKIVEEAAYESCGRVLGEYMLKHVTKGKKYEYLREIENIPCGRRKFYDFRDEFFIKLSQKKHLFL